MELEPNKIYMHENPGYKPRLVLTGSDIEPGADGRVCVSEWHGCCGWRWNQWRSPDLMRDPTPDELERLADDIEYFKSDDPEWTENRPGCG